MSRSTVMPPMLTKLWLGLVLVVGAILLIWNPLQGADFAWHLKIGSVAWEQSTTLPKEIFSYTEAGRPWLYKDLIADVILYGLYNAFGVWGFFVLKLLAFLSVAWAFRRLFAERGSVWLSLVVSVLVWGAIQYRMLERPLLFSLVCFALLVTGLERLRLRPHIEGWRNVLWALAPWVLVQWVWMQLHRGALLGYVMILGWLLGLWAAYLTRERPWSLRWLGEAPSRSLLLGASMMLPLALLLGLLNPSGIHILTTSVGVVNSDFIKQFSSEWQAISLLQFFQFFPLAALLSVVGGLGWLVVFARLSKKPQEESQPLTLWPLLAFLLFAVLAARSIRWIPYLSMVSAILVGHVLVHLEAHSKGWTLLTQRATLLVATGLASWGLLYAQRIDPWTMGINPHKVPVGAVAFIQKHKPQGNPMHSFRLGGYLMWKLWPTYKVQVDGRNDMVYPPPSFRASLLSQRRPDVFFRLQKRYNVNWVVASNHLDFQSHLFLALNTDWMMVYWSEAAVIYVKRKSYPSWKHLAYRMIHPASIDRSVYRALRQGKKDPKLVKQLHHELKRMVKASPRGLRSLLGMVLFHHWQGPSHHKERNRWAQTLRNAEGHRVEVQNLLRRLKIP